MRLISVDQLLDVGVLRLIAAVCEWLNQEVSPSDGLSTTELIAMSQLPPTLIHTLSLVC
jgi:hypothetical protein